MQPASRNLRLYPWYLATTTEGISNAVWYLFLFSYKGLSLDQMAWLVLLGDGVIVLAEIPTGWIADQLTRRLSILAGIVLQAASALLFLFGHSFWHFWLAMAVCGVGDTFRSGADQALLYDSCLATHQVQRFRALLSRSLFIMTLALMASQIIGGLIATFISWELVFYLEVVFSAFGFACVWLMQEPARLEHQPSAEPPHANPLPAAAAALKANWLWLLLPLAAFASIVGIAPELAHFYLPAELQTDFSFTPAHLGFIFAAFELMQGWGNKLAGSSRLVHPARVISWIGIGMVLALACFGLRGAIQPFLPWLALGLYLLARAAIDLLYGLAEPLISEEANRRAPARLRATALSVVNAARRVLPLLLLPLAAVVTSRQSTTVLYCYLLPMLLGLTVLSGWWLRRTQITGARAGASSDNISAYPVIPVE